jgi:hypothetical protein
MDESEYKDFEDWRRKNECHPFEDSDGNLCIAVKSKYESFGGEKDARLLEAKKYGIDRLIRFYGKTYISNPLSTPLSQIDVSDIEITLSQASITPTTPTKLYDASSTPDSFISLRECARMRVLVKIPKDAFDEHTEDDTTCDINKPAEGYLSAFISVENYERDIDYITTSMEDFLPKMAKADKFMTNINIVKEIKGLKRVKKVIRRYFNLNSVTAAAIKEEECEPDVESLIEIGFDYGYKPAFALIDGNKHTIGYDCFLEASKLNHPTTANYLIQLGNMSSALTKQRSLDFDIFQFLTQYTYPTPVIEIKENSLDGIETYDANGNLFSFANIAKLISLDLDKKSCKDDETVSKENRIILNNETRASVAKAAAQTKQFMGDWKFSTEGLEELRGTLGTMSGSVKDPVETIKEIYNDIWESTNWGCVLEESLQCMLEESITKFGTYVFDDPDLGEFFSADGAVELEGLCRPSDSCENELQLRVGLPAFQGITIPANFPTIDYLSKTMDLALKQLYNVLINSFVSLIMSLLDNVCKMISSLPDGAAIGNMFGEGFKSWLSETIGIDISLLEDGQAWQDAVMSTGGTGFMGVVGNFSAKMAGSWDAVVSKTGVSLNLPNPNTGTVEEVFISKELISNVMSGIRKGIEDVEVVLTPEEYNSLCKGSAPEPVVDLAYECLNRGNSELFSSREDITDLFSSLGEMVKGNLLESPTAQNPVVTNVCDLGDGSDQDILRKNFLRSKDSSLSDSEIEELMSREKSRFIEKIKKAHKFLKSFQDGSIFPDFPSIFGSEDSLIPAAPPIISAAMATVSEGLYSSTINNFNVSMTQYAPLWKEKILFSTDGSLQSFAKLSSKLMKYDANDGYVQSAADAIYSAAYAFAFATSPNAEAATAAAEAAVAEYAAPTDALYRKINVDDNMTNLGYTIHEDATDNMEDSVQESTLEDLGIITWDGGWADAFDAGKYSDDWWKNNAGPDDADFARLIEKAGIRYVDFSEDDFSIWSWEVAAIVAAVVLMVILIIFTAGAASGLAVATANYSAAMAGAGSLMTSTAVTAAGASAYAAGTVGILGLTSISIATLQIVTGIAVVALSLLAAGGIALLWATAAKNQEQLIYVTALVQESDDKEQVLEKIDCGYDSGELSREQYDDLIPVKNKVIDAIFEAKDILQWDFIKSIANYLEEIDDENDSVERAFDISPFLVDMDDGNKTELILKSEVAGTNLAGDGEARMSTHAYVRKTPHSSEEINLEREDGFSEVITSFERRGVRSDAAPAKEGYTKPLDMDFNKTISLQDIYDSGTSLAEYDRIENKISNYRMENESSLLLGRKIAEPNLFETRYSSTIDAPDKSIMELFESQETNNNDLQEYHLELMDIIEQSGLLSVSNDNVKTIYRDIWQDCMRAMAKRVSNNRMYLDEYLNALEFEYPKHDILGYKKVSEGSVDLTSSIMKLESSNGDYCDTLSPLRRSGSITGLRLMIRTFIVERVLNSLQVFDTFNVGFMTSDMFKKAVFDDIKVETGKYQNSFETTLDGKIFSDMKETASKYFEIQRLLGNEVPELNTDKEAILEIIKMEVGDISTTIASQLKLETLYQLSTWDDFVFDVLLTEGEYQSGVNPEDGALREFKHPSVLYPFYVNTDAVGNGDGSYTYVAELKYFDNLGLFGNIGIAVPVVRAECPGSIPTETKEGCDDAQTVADYSKVKQLLFENEIYQNLISYVFPLKDAATLLSTYHLSAITDPTVFSATINGKHVTDLFSETKLSTLQTFLACIHGVRETTYIDPFLEKLKT